MKPLYRIKKLLGRLLGQANIGRLEYLMMPRLKDDLGGPFNGQIFRQTIFFEMFTKLDFRAIVETGAYHGTTTAFLAGAGLPVYTVELNPRFYGFAELRLLRYRKRVHLSSGDTRSFLNRLAQTKDFPKSRVFFYLDAHWYENLPLAEELEIIFSNWTEAVVMVDDFQVPGTDYGYDDYGPGKSLDVTYLRPLQRLPFSTFFPVALPQEETGLKRGCVVLCHKDIENRVLEEIHTLIPAEQVRAVASVGLPAIGA